MLKRYISMTQLKLKRAYDPQTPSDGFRIFIDRLWPRGLSHATFHYNLWDKDIAPSTQLREWYHAAPAVERFDEFARRYRTELEANPAFGPFKTLVMSKPVVTLLYSSHDPLRNNAVVVRDLLTNQPTQAS